MRSKRLAITGGVLGVAVAAVGVLHMPFARGLLMRAGGCPMAGAHMTAVESEAARHRSLEVSGAGAALAPARPALGFRLDATTAADVHAWAARERVDCEDTRPGLVECKDVAAAALGAPGLGAVAELALAFDTAGKLVNMTTFRTGLDARSASASASAIVASLEGQLGPAPRHAGSFDAAHLAQPGARSIAAVAYRYSDYVADVEAMNAPSGGPTIREHYMSAL